MRPHGEPRVVAWVDDQQAGAVYLTAVTTAELRYGVARLPDGRRRTELADRIQLALEEDFTGRILAFTTTRPPTTGLVGTGLAISMADAQIAAICRHHGAELATRNTKDFALTGIGIVDPWQATTAT